jgi:hypothetical protein
MSLSPALQHAVNYLFERALGGEDPTSREVLVRRDDLQAIAALLRAEGHAPTPLPQPGTHCYVRTADGKLDDNGPERLVATFQQVRTSDGHLHLHCYNEKGGWSLWVKPHLVHFDVAPDEIESFEAIKSANHPTNGVIQLPTSA